MATEGTDAVLSEVEGEHREDSILKRHGLTRIDTDLHCLFEIKLEVAFEGLAESFFIFSHRGHREHREDSILKKTRIPSKNSGQVTRIDAVF
jgi:hypothetical protein